jgi:ribosomal protein L20A (L18A)
MAKRGRHSFIKYQKELKRKKKAEEKLAKRLGKKDMAIDVDGIDEVEVEDVEDLDVDEVEVEDDSR